MSGLHRSSSAPSKNGLPPQELLDDLCSLSYQSKKKENRTLGIIVNDIPSLDFERHERLVVTQGMDFETSPCSCA